MRAFRRRNSADRIREIPHRGLRRRNLGGGTPAEGGAGDGARAWEGGDVVAVGAGGGWGVGPGMGAEASLAGIRIMAGADRPEREGGTNPR